MHALSLNCLFKSPTVGDLDAEINGEAEIFCSERSDLFEMVAFKVASIALDLRAGCIARPFFQRISGFIGENWMIV